jgi:hypothetical protein
VRPQSNWDTLPLPMTDAKRAVLQHLDKLAARLASVGAG